MSTFYRVITDAAGDTLPELAEKLNIDVIPMEVHMGDMDFLQYVDFRGMPPKEFYDRVRAGAMPSTTQITPVRYLEFFTPILEGGDDILYICFSSGMSETFNSCRIAVDELREKFPERKIMVVDSLGATGGQGLFTCYAAENRNKGMSIEENAAWCEENVLHMAYYWTVDNLMHLKRGGRVRAVSAYVGTALNIKPVGHIDDEGHLPAIAKARGRKASIKKMVEYMRDTIIRPEGQHVLICHCDCPDDAAYLKSLIEELKLPLAEIHVGYVGPVVGAHLGPGGLTLFYWADHR